MAKGKARKAKLNPQRQNDLFVIYDLTVPAAMAEDSFASTLFRKACRTFLKPIHRERTMDALLEGLGQVHQILEEQLDERESATRIPGLNVPPLACKAGCHYCCHMRISCLAPSVLLAARLVRDAEMKARVESHFQETALLSPLEQALSFELCPLNRDGLCGVYEGRPLLCRGFHSLKLADCQQAFDARDKGVTVLQDHRLKVIQAVLTSAVEACCRALNLPSQELELIPALRIALERPDAGDAYLRGEDVFSAAHRSEVIAAQERDYEARLGGSQIRQV